MPEVSASGAESAIESICRYADDGWVTDWELVDDEHAAWYTVAEKIRDRNIAGRICDAVHEVMRPRIARAAIDAFTDLES